MIGFSSYDSPVSTALTTQEILASLSGAQKLAILNGFAEGVPVRRLMFQRLIDKSVIAHLYRKIDEIEELSRKLMRGEIVVSEAVYGEVGELLTPEVYNTPPGTSTALKNAVGYAFVDDFTEAQVIAVLAKMIAYSKSTKDSTWAYYKASVVLQIMNIKINNNVNA